MISSKNTQKTTKLKDKFDFFITKLKQKKKCNISKLKDFYKIKATKPIACGEIKESYDYIKYAGFYGNVQTSKNGKGAIVTLTGFCPIDENNYNKYGYRNGKIALFYDKKLIIKKEYSPIFRILESCVSCSGIFGVCFKIEKEELKNILFLYNFNTNKSFPLIINANFRFVNFSSSERHILIQTYAAKSSHGNKVILINTTSGDFEFMFDTPTYFSEAYVDDDKKTISIKDSQSDSIFYSISFKDKRTHQVLLENMNIEGKIYYLEKTSTREELLNNPIYAKLLEKAPSLYKNPYFLRKLGEYHDHNNNIEEAILYYEKAVGLYEKIGVKRRLNKLKKCINKRLK